MTTTFEVNTHAARDALPIYAYDLENRMTSATVSGTATTYTYDGDGNRLSATASGTTTNYLWDTNETLPLLALERNGASGRRGLEDIPGLLSVRLQRIRLGHPA